MTFDAGAQLVHRRGHPDHALRRRGQQEPLSDDAARGARRRRHRAGHARTSCCRSPTRWTAGPATPPARGPAAQPAAGWVDDPDPERDYRLNILRLHDEMERRPATFQAALAQGRIRRAGPVRHAPTDGKPVLCAACHASNALPGPASRASPPLTRPSTRCHASVTDPTTGLTLGRRPRTARPATAATPARRRAACAAPWETPWPPTARCRCSARAATAGMARWAPPRGRAGSTSRPARTATPARPRATPARSATPRSSTPRGSPREAVDPTFATNADTPAAGLSLYRFSRGTAACSARPATARRTPSTPAPTPTTTCRARAPGARGHACPSARPATMPPCHDDPAGRTGCTRSGSRGSGARSAPRGGPARVPGLPRRGLPRHGPLARAGRPHPQRRHSARGCSAKGRLSAATVATTGRAAVEAGGPVVPRVYRRAAPLSVNIFKAKLRGGAVPAASLKGGRYEIRGILGQGGMGVVYKCYDTVIRREVALKTIRDAPDKLALEMFYKECNVLAGMSHPNIVEIFDIGELGGAGRAQALLRHAAAAGRAARPPDQDLQPAAHRRAQRRDHLPDLPRPPGGARARARAPRHQARATSSSWRTIRSRSSISAWPTSADRTPLGGQGHAASTWRPSRLQMKPPTALSDIFSLGVVAYQAFTRRRPFEGATEAEIAQAILRRIPPPASDLNPAVNQTISRVLHKAMAKQPWHRFASARELSEALQKAARNEPWNCSIRRACSRASSAPRAPSSRATTSSPPRSWARWRPRATSIRPSRCCGGRSIRHPPQDRGATARKRPHPHGGGRVSAGAAKSAGGARTGPRERRGARVQGAHRAAAAARTRSTNGAGWRASTWTATASPCPAGAPERARSCARPTRARSNCWPKWSAASRSTSSCARKRSSSTRPP